MGPFHTFLRWVLGIVIPVISIYPAFAHYNFDHHNLNVIPGKACGLQTEMRYLDALGKYVTFLYCQICS